MADIPRKAAMGWAKGDKMHACQNIATPNATNATEAPSQCCRRRGPSAPARSNL